MVEHSIDVLPDGGSATQFYASEVAISWDSKMWVPIVISLLGGVLIGSLFALAALATLAQKDWPYFIAFVVTGIICTFLPAVLLILIMWWAGMPLRSQQCRRRE